MKSAVAMLAVGLCVLAFPVCAETQAPDSSKPDPDTTLARSVFVLDDAGNATHQQTGWQCPARFGGYQRHDLHLFDSYGLDISCDYLKPGEGDITLYLTKRTGGDLKADFEGGKQALVQRTSGAVPLADADQKTFASDRPWLHMLYSSDTRGTLDGVWYAWYGDWAFEIRATFTQADEDAVFATMAQMTDAARDTGAHLARCAAPPPPVRSGSVITDADQISQLSMMVGITTGAAHIADPKTGKPAVAAAPHPVEWCAEGGIAIEKNPVLIWHGLNADGTVSPFDRATIMTYGDPPVLESAPDMELTTILSELHKGGPAPLYTATLTQGDNTVVLGFFQGRPDGGALALLLSRYRSGAAGALASFNGKTNTITITVPSQPNGHPKD